MNKSLIEFYNLTGTDIEGRLLSDMWGWSDEKMEVCHDYIQHWFPTLTPSMFNESAPIPDEEDMVLFRKDPVLQENLNKSFHRFLRFLGLGLAYGGIYYKPDYSTTKKYIWSKFNHNHLRITRLLESMRIMGQRENAEILLEFLETNTPNLSENTRSHWRNTRQWDNILKEEI